MRMKYISQILIKGLLLLCCLSGGPAFAYHYLFINTQKMERPTSPRASTRSTRATTATFG